MNSKRSFNFVMFYVIYSLVAIKLAEAGMSISGPIVSSAAVVNGNVAMSSMTVSTLTVSSSLVVSSGTLNNNIPGRVFQVLFTSITTVSATSCSTTTWTEVSGLSRSITLRNAGNSVRVSVSGNLKSQDIYPGYLTVFRDATNIGDASNGLAAAISKAGGAPNNSVGLTFMDTPGDTSAHTYHVYIRSFAASGTPPTINFSWNCPGSLLLEEVGR